MRFTTALFQRAKPPTNKPVLQYPHSSPDRSVTHITSEKLCDDVLEVLRHTLPAPQTCDIIDLNPGLCVWSEKLHNLVKPRRHVLVEPRRESFASVIDPLLTRPNSPYRYATDLETALDPHELLLSQEIYDFRNTLGDSPAHQYVRNDGLLIVANLSAPAAKAIGFKKTQAKQFLYKYYRAIFVQQKFIHRYGLARLLAWVGDDARHSIMPLSVNGRTKQSVQLEASCAMHQVAGPRQSQGLHNHHKCHYDLEVESQREVRLLQKQLKLKIPVERDQPDPIVPFTALQPNVEEVRRNRHLYPYNQVFVNRLLELHDHLSTTQPEWYLTYEKEADNQFSDRTKYGQGFYTDPERTAYRRLMTQLRTHHNTYMKAKDFIWEQRQLAHEIQHAYRRGWLSPTTCLPADGPNKAEAEKLIKKDSIMHEQLQRVKVDTRRLITKAGDDYRCFDSSPRILPWNQRKHDPLLVQANEFSHNSALSLFDFQPRPELPLQLDTFDKQICFDYVCMILTTHAADTVEQGLQRLVPGGYDQFLEMLPILKNPTRGGWWNLSTVRIRSLHPDHFIAIALAFHDWPGRPAMPSLVTAYKGVFDEGPQ